MLDGEKEYQIQQMREWLRKIRSTQQLGMAGPAFGTSVDAKAIIDQYGRTGIGLSLTPSVITPPLPVVAPTRAERELEEVYSIARQVDEVCCRTGGTSHGDYVRGLANGLRRDLRNALSVGDVGLVGEIGADIEDLREKAFHYRRTCAEGRAELEFESRLREVERERERLEEQKSQEENRMRRIIREEYQRIGSAQTVRRIYDGSGNYLGMEEIEGSTIFHYDHKNRLVRRIELR